MKRIRPGTRGAKARALKLAHAKIAELKAALSIASSTGARIRELEETIRQLRRQPPLGFNQYAGDVLVRLEVVGHGHVGRVDQWIHHDAFWNRGSLAFAPRDVLIRMLHEFTHPNGKAAETIAAVLGEST